MKCPGLELQRLVEVIERALLPAGFLVRGNERICDDSGKQIAEFDVEITGKLGSSTITWLIECRDRPSEGPAPGQWIEQLVGRRDRFNFDKVTAVSTTGFSSGAQGFALRKGIELRTMKAVTPDAFRSWLGINSMRFTIHRGELFLAAINVEGDVSDTVTADLLNQVVNLKNTKGNLDVPFLISTAIRDKHTFRREWKNVMANGPEMFRGIEPNCDVRTRLIKVHYPDPKQRYVLQVHDEDVHVTCIEFHAKISITEKDVPISNITEYVETLGNESIAQSVSFLADTDEGTVWECSLHKLQQAGHIAVAARIVNEESKAQEP